VRPWRRHIRFLSGRHSTLLVHSGISATAPAQPSCLSSPPPSLRVRPPRWPPPGVDGRISPARSKSPIPISEQGTAPMSAASGSGGNSGSSPATPPQAGAGGGEQQQRRRRLTGQVSPLACTECRRARAKVRLSYGGQAPTLAGTLLAEKTDALSSSAMARGRIRAADASAAERDVFMKPTPRRTRRTLSRS
jgi:hypothetical protein